VAVASATLNKLESKAREKGLTLDQLLEKIA